MIFVPNGIIIILPNGKHQMEGVEKVRLEEIRKQKHFTRRRLSIASGVTENSIFRYERKMRVPDVETAGTMARALGCTVDDLLSDTHESEPKAQEA